MSAQNKPATQSGKPVASPNIQGEGDYASTRKFRQDTEEFLKGADVPELARQAAPKSKEEAAALKNAEDIGRSRSHGGDTAAPKSPPAKPGEPGR